MNNISVAAFVEQAIARGGKRLISVPNMVSELRLAKPDCEHTDDELAHLITVIAINKGCDLSFMRPKGFDAVDW